MNEKFNEIIALVPENARGYFELAIRLSDAFNQVELWKKRATTIKDSYKVTVSMLVRMTHNSIYESFVKKYIENGMECIKEDDWDNPFNTLIREVKKNDIPLKDFEAEILSVLEEEKAKYLETLKEKESKETKEGD